MSLAALARRAIAEHRHQEAVFDLPERKWYRGDGSLDLSVDFHGERASTPLGPAAGPQSQLAQNIALSWLGGSRIIELKTVQQNDTLELPRPCIDATNVGYNVEWSQELRVPESLREYVKAQMLIRILKESGVAGDLAETRPDLLFDLSVGYDLAGIRTPKVTDFIRGMVDAREVIDSLRTELSGDLARYRDLDFAHRISDCVTLSTFHGCPADEIESICRYLLEDLGVHVVVKMNPTLLGYDEVCSILNEKLGYADIAPIQEEFERDLQWDQALAMMGRLGEIAERCERMLGAKFTNTLVVKNHRSFFPDEDRMYMSGQPLFPISLSLALNFREAMGASFPISFSAGIDARNFPDAVACGMTPITTCTDLLRPGGYGRLFKYLTALEKRMHKLEASDIRSYILRCEGAEAAGIKDVHEASLHNMRTIVGRVLNDPRYTLAKNAAVPRKIGSQLVLFDCISCDKCVPVCPNDANFVFDVQASSSFSERATINADGSIEHHVGEPFVVERQHQIGNYADFCNDCGNCDIFCPEDGGPYIEKPRFFGSLQSFEAFAKHGGFFIEASTDLIKARARIEGRDYAIEIERGSGGARFSDDVIELILAPKTGVIEASRLVAGAEAPAGHSLSTHPAKSMLTIISGVLDETRPNPLTALGN